MTPELNWLSDPTVFAVNRLDAHSDHVCYRTMQEAAQRHSSLRQPLDGMWHFVWSSCPAQRPADFWREGADLSGFGTIRVPGHMETQGYGQLQYTNTLYPWDGRSALRPPQVDLNDDPVGSYAREFDLEPGCAGSGYASASRVWNRPCTCGAMASSWAMPRTALPPRNLT